MGFVTTRGSHMSGYDISGVLDESRRVGQNALLKLGKQIAEVRSIEEVKSVECTLGSLGVDHGWYFNR